ncbi:MAG: DUF2612 domain-containing protein [Oscillibacter sp.]|nr:DUF2612 domain-containing protein [Oscillibacter sp.]
MPILDAWFRDIPQQFLGKRNIEALITAFARQLQEVETVFQELRDKTDLQTATGKNLDNVGTIIPLSRKEAGMLAGANSPEYVISDERYRLYLKYKLLSLTSECTYSDIIAAARMFWNGPLRYSEPSDEPASYHLDAYVQNPWQDVGDLLRAPAIRSAGVGTGITVHFPEVESGMRIGGQESVDSEMPLTVVDDVFSFEAALHIGGGMGITPGVTVRPIGDALRMESTLRLGGRARLISKVAAPPEADSLSMENTVRLGGAAGEMVSRSVAPIADALLFESTLRLGGTAAIVTTIPIAGDTLLFLGEVGVGGAAELSVKLPVPIAPEIITIPIDLPYRSGIIAELITRICIPNAADTPEPDAAIRIGVLPERITGIGIPTEQDALKLTGAVHIGTAMEIAATLPILTAPDVHTLPQMESAQASGVLAEIQTVVGVPQQEDIFISAIRTGGLAENAVSIPVPEIK